MRFRCHHLLHQWLRQFRQNSITTVRLTPSHQTFTSWTDVIGFHHLFQLHVIAYRVSKAPSNAHNHMAGTTANSGWSCWLAMWFVQVFPICCCTVSMEFTPSWCWVQNGTAVFSWGRMRQKQKTEKGGHLELKGFLEPVNTLVWKSRICNSQIKRSSTLGTCTGRQNQSWLVFPARPMQGSLRRRHESSRICKKIFRAQEYLQLRDSKRPERTIRQSEER